jgi:hypothetical protein
MIELLLAKLYNVKCFSFALDLIQTMYIEIRKPVMQKEEKEETETNSNFTFPLIVLLILFSSLTIFAIADYSMVIAFKPSPNLPPQPPAIPNQEQQMLRSNLTEAASTSVNSNFSPLPPLPKYLHPTTDCNPDNPCS